MKVLSALIISAFIFLPSQVFAVKAFPTAVGFGADAIGGRGGNVCYVTTLADNLNPGSLRYCLYEVEVPRIVQFKVAGYIDLVKPLGATSADILITHPFVTIAGQTAPGGGVCIRNGGIAIEAHDVIIRHLCIRPGDDSSGTKPEDRDAFKIRSYNVILDHVSASFSIDENISIWKKNGQPAPHHITIQHSMITWGLYNSLHPKGPHSRGLLIGDHAKQVTVYQNVMAHNNRRNPMVKGDTFDVHIVNNIMYNWGNLLTTSIGYGTNYSDPEESGPSNSGIVNNYLLKGPNSGDQIIAYDVATMDMATRVLLDGNYYSDPTFTDALYIGVFSPVMYTAPWAIPNIPAPFNLQENARNINLQENAVDILLNAGVLYPKRFDLDIRAILDIVGTTGSIINTPSQAGGYPAIASGAPFEDADNDGIYDLWELVVGLNPANPFDAQAIGPNGYSYLEEFVNEVAWD
jgi:hypothetical protein